MNGGFFRGDPVTVRPRCGPFSGYKGVVTEVVGGAVLVRLTSGDMRYYTGSLSFAPRQLELDEAAVSARIAETFLGADRG